MLTDTFDIPNKVLGSIIFYGCVGVGTATSALIKKNNAIFFRIKKTTMIRFTTRTRPAVHKKDGDTCRFPALFNIQYMWIPHLDMMRRVGLDLGVQIPHCE
jgi:hypothetical protein